MQTQIEYITNLARQYKVFAESSDELFSAVNELSDETICAIYTEYGEGKRNFQPVNLLRAEVARLLRNGVEITKRLVEEIKTKIRLKEIAYFSHLSPEFLKQFEDYTLGKRDLFANWQKDWNVFHIFFYRGTTKETTQLYLAQIGNQLLQDLELGDYTFHWVDFYGANNFGSTYCWLALYPQNKPSHKDSHQFFLKFGSTIEVGRTTGSNIKNPQHLTKDFSTYPETLTFLCEIKSDIISSNNKIRNYFKFAPGRNASEWERFKDDEIIAASYDNLPIGDISEINSLQELNVKCGFGENDSSYGGTWHLWLLKSAHIGDIVFASRGTSICIGIGVIEGEYYFNENAEDYKHRRKVKWITDKIYEYTPYAYTGYPKMFRADTFSPTLIWQFILSEYIRLYPELKEVFNQNNLKYEKPIVEEIVEPNPEVIERLQESNYWWLVAKPSVWSFTEYEVGGRQTYTSKNEDGNKRRIFKHFENVKVGDLLIGYESSPIKQIKAICEITKPLHKSETEGEIIEFQIIEKLNIPIFFNELQNNLLLKNSEVFINNLQGSLFKLSEDEFDIIREIIDEKNIIPEFKHPVYSFAEDIDKPFIAEKDFLQAVELLKRKKNIILQGSPGVGKTFIARKLAYQIIGQKADSQIEMVQFHQSFAYEDFVQGLRLVKDGTQIRNGIFYNFCKFAANHPVQDFFFIIDEINRGNLSKIFGELMMLVEHDKREEKYALKLTYAEDEHDKFFVPPNVHLIGTMNTADRSLAIVDYALRRRFAFFTLQPQFAGDFRDFLQTKGVSENLIGHICRSVLEVNQTISADANLGAGFQIGHSYFCDGKIGADENLWFQEILNFEIRPLLEEIWFDDQKQIDEMIEKLTF